MDGTHSCVFKSEGKEGEREGGREGGRKGEQQQQQISFSLLMYVDARGCRVAGREGGREGGRTRWMDISNVSLLKQYE